MSALRFTGGLARGRGWLEYLRSEAGRRRMLSLSGIAGAGIAAVVWAPQCIAIRWTRDTMQMYKDGYPVKPTPYVVDLAAQALSDCKLTEVEAKHIRWFTAFGFDPIHKGQISMTQGAIIGLPKTFAYNSTDDVDRMSIKMHRDTSIPWKSEAGEALLTSLVFSDAARKFAIAREIFSCQTQHVLVKCTAMGMVLPVFTSLLSRLNERLSIYRYPLNLRMSWHTVCTAIGLVVAVMAWDSIHKTYERLADGKIVELGESYLEGAVEYCSKRLLANRALRELLGEEGKNTITEEGNVRHWLWKPHLTLTERKEFFEGRLKDLRRAKSLEEKKKIAKEEEEDDDDDEDDEMEKK